MRRGGNKSLQCAVIIGWMGVERDIGGLGSSLSVLYRLWYRPNLDGLVLTEPRLVLGGCVLLLTEYGAVEPISDRAGWIRWMGSRKTARKECMDGLSDNKAPRQ
ncbi:hypothetical protein F2Q69_00037750 [Brassica cretica]|uniref:Uncharacterized protein n=1 Tax=Brassica cretica TaxID=69181 RepID=A0A8S9SQ82_BRACR|nr:hypothetical protein F2Q69_00037750 [Brassica cretica]